MKLTLAPHKPSSKASFVFDWDSIEDKGHRSTARVLVESLAKTYQNSVREVEQIAKRYTGSVSRTVWSMKQQLPHGLFRAVCRQALNLNDNQSACYAQIGKYIEEGAVFGKALEMVEQMEPRAAGMYIRSTDEAKHCYVATFEETGKVPSQRDFAKPKPSPTSVPSCVISPPELEALTPVADTKELSMSQKLDQFTNLLGQLSWDEIAVSEELVAKLHPWAGVLEGIVDMTKPRRSVRRYV
jgi:hypothetical protein